MDQIQEVTQDQPKWPLVDKWHLFALISAYNEGYSKAADGRTFENPFSPIGSQADAWALGTKDGWELYERLKAAKSPDYFKNICINIKDVRKRIDKRREEIDEEDDKRGGRTLYDAKMSELRTELNLWLAAIDCAEF